MTDKPILMSAPMVLAILREIACPGTGKTMTRRKLTSGYIKLWREFKFRQIDGYPNYLIGRDGIVYRDFGGAEVRPLKANPGSKGYAAVSLCHLGKATTKNVHSIVAKSWLGPAPSERHEARHLNSDRMDSRLENIDWATPEENWADRSSLGNGVRENHWCAKLTLEQAAAIRASTDSQRDLATEYGVAQSTVWSIKAGGAWSELPIASPRSVPLPHRSHFWVREAWAPLSALTHNDPGTAAIAANGFYRADGSATDGEIKRWRPSIHMPRWASRLTLTVTEVKIECLQDISRDDAIAEGIVQTWGDFMGDPPQWAVESIGPRYGSPGGHLYDNRTSVENFRILWESLHGPEAWKINPWICAVRFRPELRNIDAPARPLAPQSPLLLQGAGER